VARTCRIEKGKKELPIQIGRPSVEVMQFARKKRLNGMALTQGGNRWEIGSCGGDRG
jgi:hypothetical protein